jgi:hypothetical protein
MRPTSDSHGLSVLRAWVMRPAGAPRGTGDDADHQTALGAHNATRISRNGTHGSLV